MNNKIRHVLDSLPNKPGVYFMKDDSGTIIYIGKAKNLKNRVSSYFSSTKKNLKTQLLVSNIDSIEYVLASSEEDAFSLESNLIKENQPKYNILLKDDKLFPYIRIDKREKFPTLSVVRRVKNDGALYFGPYVTGLRVGEFVEIIKSVFKVKQCKQNFDKKQNSRMCLFGDMGNCLAPCVGKISSEDYKKVIDDVIDFLNGKNSLVKNILTEKMNLCSDLQDYEQAIVYRNQLVMLEKSDKYILSNLAKDENFDSFAIGSLDRFVCVNINCVRNGKTILDKNLLIEPIDESLEEALSNFILQYYEINLLPEEILVNLEICDVLKTAIKNIFNKNVLVKTPMIGTKKKIVDMANDNISEFLDKNLEVCKVREEMKFGALEELSKILNLKTIPNRIECYDISNISGTNSVASMVVFNEGSPNKKQYRKFKIKTVKGSNDFESLKETLKRRFLHLKNNDENFAKPDLIVVDGGLGQLHSCYEVELEMGIDIPIISLAKKEEEIYTLNSTDSIKLPPSSNAKKLLIRLRDEAHRFAINYHKKLRENNMLKNNQV